MKQAAEKRQTVRQRLFELWDAGMTDGADEADLDKWAVELHGLVMLFKSEEQEITRVGKPIPNDSMEGLDIPLLVGGWLPFIAFVPRRRGPVKVGPANAPAAEPILRHVVAVLEREVER